MCVYWMRKGSGGVCVCVCVCVCMCMCERACACLHAYAPEGIKGHYRCVQPVHLLCCRPLSRKQLRWWAARHNRAALSESSIKLPQSQVQQESGHNTEQYSFSSHARYIHIHFITGPQWIFFPPSFGQSILHS